MATKYYKKPSPKQPVYVGGNPIRFDQVTVEVGVFRTDDEGIQRAFAELQARGVGGIFDITEADYTSLVQKKTTTSHQPYRDEFAMGQSHQKTHLPSSDLVYRAEESSPVEPSRTALPGNSENVPEPTPEQPAKRPAPRKRAQQ